MFFSIQEFLDQVVDSCSNRIAINSSVFSPPVRVEDPPVYGKKDLSFIDYMGPGVITRYNIIIISHKTRSNETISNLTIHPQAPFPVFNVAC